MLHTTSSEERMKKTKEERTIARQLGVIIKKAHQQLMKGENL